MRHLKKISRAFQKFFSKMRCLADIFEKIVLTCGAQAYNHIMRAKTNNHYFQLFLGYVSATAKGLQLV